MHPDERKWIEGHLKDFEAFYQKTTGQAITDQQASDMLLVAGFHDVDQTAANSSQANPYASQFISGNAGGLFTASTYDYLHPNVGANANGSLTPEQAALSNGSGTPAPPGFRPPDYASGNGSGMSVAYGGSVNLHNGQFYGGGGKANPFSPSGNVMFGYLLSPGDNPTIDTKNFLDGASVPVGGCMIVCIGFNHSLGGQTSVEIGLGTFGISTGVTVSKPIFGGAHWGKSGQ